MGSSMRRFIVVQLALVVSTVALAAVAQPGTARPASRQGTDVAAVIGDHIIRLSDVDRYWREQEPASFNRIQQRLYEARRRALDSLIGEYLLTRESEKRKVSVDHLLAQATQATTVGVTETEIEEAYARSSAAGRGVTLEQARPTIVAYLSQQKAAQARQRFLEALKRGVAADIVVVLQAPRRIVPVTERDPAQGSRLASVQLVVFSDFQCPYCRRAMPVLKRLVAKYGDQARLVWKDFPLPTHPMAALAAEAAQCAHDQGKFWDYHDRLFGEAQNLEPTRLRTLAAEVGVDMAVFNQCMESRQHRDRVATSLREGRRLGVEATPTVFINGRIVTGLATFDTYERLLVDELAAIRAGGAPR